MNRQGIYLHPENLISSHNDIRMSIQEIFIVKSDIADDTEPVGDHAEFIGIAEMSVDVHLLDGRIGGGMGGT